MNMKAIPVIDIASLHSTRTLESLDRACREWGFFQVTNHGIDQELTTKLFSAMHGFFILPLAEKRAISRSASNPWGFYDQELTKNALDWKQIYDYGPSDDDIIRPQWPQSPTGFRAAIQNYYRECESLSYEIISAISVNLGMPQEYLANYFRRNHTSFLRLNYYPLCPVPARPDGLSAASEGHLGINHHTDAGALTVLLQDQQPGLEVYRGGQWHLVEPRDDALVINIGDIVQVWSNDIYKASLHRVIASTNQPRFSVPFFFNPAYQTDYQPLPSTVDLYRPPKYRSINWGEFRSQRAAGDYADYGEEIQINHYRTQAG